MPINFSIPKTPDKTPQKIGSYAEHMTAKPVMGNMSVETIKSKQVTSAKLTNEVVKQAVAIPKERQHLITVEGGRTLNLGNFESAKIGVSITIPCTYEDLDAAYEFGSDWISAKIEAVEKDFKG